MIWDRPWQSRVYKSGRWRQTETAFSGHVATKCRCAFPQSTRLAAKQCAFRNVSLRFNQRRLNVLLRLFVLESSLRNLYTWISLQLSSDLCPQQYWGTNVTAQCKFALWYNLADRCRMCAILPWFSYASGSLQLGIPTSTVFKPNIMPMWCREMNVDICS